MHIVVHVCAYVLIRAHIVRLRDLAAKDMHTYEQYEHIVPYTSMNEYIQRYIQNIHEYNKAYEYTSLYLLICVYICNHTYIYRHI